MNWKFIMKQIENVILTELGKFILEIDTGFQILHELLTYSSQGSFVKERFLYAREKGKFAICCAACP